MIKKTFTFISNSVKVSGNLHLCMLILTCMFSVTSCTLLKNLLKPDETGLKAYEGKWYVILALPNRIEEGLVCTTTVFKFNDDGTLTVTSSGREKSSSGKVKSFTARAWLPDKNKPDTFRVQIFFTMTRDYKLVYMSGDNSCAILGSPAKHQMWILCRTPVPDEDTITMLVQTAGDNGYNIRRLVKIDQSCGE